CHSVLTECCSLCVCGVWLTEANISAVIQHPVSFFFFFSFLSLTLTFAPRTGLSESGQAVTLPCRAPNNNILVVEWSRTDLKSDYVFLYRDEQSDPEDQHPSFKNRVDLQDRQMKDGDVSLILNNVTINDVGTYKCPCPHSQCSS
uniref:Ig-like domain-containing protein n=1 Tax=Oreochromis niloticus TaxID=8128 RepID=A0A669D7U0_ORENI